MQNPDYPHVPTVKGLWVSIPQSHAHTSLPTCPAFLQYPTNQSTITGDFHTMSVTFHCPV